MGTESNTQMFRHRFGLYTFDLERMPADVIGDWVRELEAEGWASLWFPEIGDREAMSTASFLLGATQRLAIVNAIAQIGTRSARATFGAAARQSSQPATELRGQLMADRRHHDAENECGNSRHGDQPRRRSRLRADGHSVAYIRPHRPGTRRHTFLRVELFLPGRRHIELDFRDVHNRLESWRRGRRQSRFAALHR
ncbi:hypothetical protein FZI85_30325 [Mycobacterium sp. CBMA293]|uniref:hypothetical protein n=1 Tax=unclassified Mycolicibacterium TaxID=2636767 RepID=UPI0012DE1C67|nr:MULTISPECIES: hypothetical protein [unclassified Mycolicibacterium]MUL50138.1 hypothetical protein [Mycolicibacterium sp. CBMA 360]MUL62795.1 hypothetical protein [Mycolicibacterium sp. CBMA 335]MUL69605.1 hypothetical protein [Mycolicibacterium sp. CBMA 311]MUL97446.1 hypothetical protein [Mycolicibacterium sp. CBMA 230]MUM05003.1 hypothetical protein [Mycolicibacterium sp. CBMA 213]